MFNTLGNTAANPDAGLLFVDFERGGTLQLAGVVEFRVDEVDDALPLRWRFAGYSPFSPSLEGHRGEEAT